MLFCQNAVRIANETEQQEMAGVEKIDKSAVSRFAVRVVAIGTDQQDRDGEAEDEKRCVNSEDRQNGVPKGITHRKISEDG